MAAKRETETMLLRRVVQLRDEVDALKAQLAEERSQSMRTWWRLQAERKDLAGQVTHYQWQALKRLDGVHIQRPDGTPVAWQN